jgi:hypothetical protein
MMLFGYWMMSCPQLLGNEFLERKEQSSHVAKNGHTI